MELIPVPIPEQRPLEVGGGTFPLALGPSAPTSATASGLAEWCARHRAELRESCLRHGAVLLRGCNVNGAEDFAAATRALGCEGYDYVGGAAPRTELVPGVVFTANEAPPQSDIPFHHELAQAPCPPAYILFHCEEAAQVGGATPIIPSEEVAAFFFRSFPEFASKVQQLGVRYVRVMPEVTDETSAQGRSWRETYGVSSREEAEAAMRVQGTSWEWLPGGDCRTTTAALPALRTDARTGKKVFFNSIVAAFTGWNDARNVGEKAVVLGDGTPVDGDALRAVAEFMRQRRVSFRWHAGDVLLVDNTLVMHSREPFQGKRRVLAAMRGPPLPAAALRVGILGAGAMGKEHIRNIRLLGRENAYVAAVADTNERARREAVGELGADAALCTVCSDDNEVVRDASIDALLVCTPNYIHIDLLRRAIPTNKHVLCEKPLCTTVEDCQEVERLIQERDATLKAQGLAPGVFMTGMEYRWMPPIARLIQEVDSGNHGPPRVVSIREHRFPFLVKVDNWNRFNKYTGGTLVEKACHFFDLMRRIIGSEPVSVYASGGQAMNHKDEVYDREGSPDVIDHALAVVEFENSARASLDLCMFAEDEQTEQVTAVCELGKIEARSPESTVRVLRRRHVRGLGRTPPAPEERAMADVLSLPVPTELAAAGYHEGATFFELRAFVEAIRDGRPAPVTAHDGTMAVRMGWAAHESISTGKVVHLTSKGRSPTPLPRAADGVADVAAPTLLPSPAASARSRL